MLWKKLFLNESLNSFVHLIKSNVNLYIEKNITFNDLFSEFDESLKLIQNHFLVSNREQCNRVILGQWI